MKLRLALALLALLPLAASAQAQNFPQVMPPNTVYGRTGVSAGPGQAIPFTSLTPFLMGPFFPGLSTNVAGSGVPGLDNPGCSGPSNCGWYIHQVVLAPTAARTPALTLHRETNYTGGTSGTTVQALYVNSSTSPHSVFYEWPITSLMLNHTEGTTGAQNVAINGTAQKVYWPGFSAEIGPTWASNFSCQDSTGRVDPQWSCLGSEINVGALSSAGTDNQRQRIPLQIAWGAIDRPATLTDNLHFGAGILFTGGDLSQMDNGILFAGAGPYGQFISALPGISVINAINLNQATITQAAFLSPGIIIDGKGGAGLGSSIVFSATGVGNIVFSNSTATNGINLNQAIFSGAAFLSPGFAVNGTGAINATLPTSAGGGGLFVCVDTAGNFYKKATCP